MIKRTIILTTAAVCLAASLLLIINFTFRNAAEPAWLGDRFSRTESVCALREPTYEHMRGRMQEYRRYAARIKKGNAGRPAAPARPEKAL